jgi:hypothetical protein
MTRITTTFAVFALASIAAAQTPPAPQPIQPKAFASPDQAAKALIDAASRNDDKELMAILGSRAQGVLTAGNPAQDQAERQEFSKLASAKNHIERSSIDSRTAVLLVGNEDWPFPVPLVQTGQQWRFDPTSGVMEMRARRIGANELDAIEICMGYVGAQQAYYAQASSGKGPPGYAQKIMSSPGSKDGLYQPGASPELVPEGFAMAAAGSPERKPYHGYYFRVLTQQGASAPGGAHKYVAGGAMIGGFALIAWPAEYGASGIHTFIVSHAGDVFEKDLGAGTANAAAQIASYDPDSTWTAVDGL